MCIFVYVYMCLCACIYIYIYIYIHTSIYAGARDDAVHLGWQLIEPDRGPAILGKLSFSWVQLSLRLVKTIGKLSCLSFTCVFYYHFGDPRFKTSQHINELSAAHVVR